MPLLLCAYDTKLGLYSSEIAGVLDRLAERFGMSFTDVHITEKNRYRDVKFRKSFSNMLMKYEQKSFPALSFHEDQSGEGLIDPESSDNQAGLLGIKNAKVVYLFCRRAGTSELVQFLQNDDDLGRLVAHAYGYALDWGDPPNNSPSAFALGIVMFTTLEGIRSACSSSRLNQMWGDAIMSGKKDYLNGYFRDIFPVNFISERHLDISLGDRTLKDLIEQDPGVFGRTIQLAEDSFAWLVSEDRLERVRSVLKVRGLLLAA